ncbi:MAG TPA: hypothetical protein VG838_03785 [Opitutaceae bacterium]|nr:hypothetical protein [Opitutaceae bacterium]
MKVLPLLALAASAALAIGADSHDEAGQELARQANHREYSARVSQLTSRLESFIAEELVKKQGATEYPPARRYLMRDLDGDKKDDLLLITTFEPLSEGNHHDGYLFAVLSSRPQEVQQLVIGGRGWRDADHFEENATRLFLHFKVWAESDAQCCPSLATTEEIIFEKGRVVLRPFDEIRRKGQGW